MASIKITERDLTTPGTASVNTNVAYVPGYAVMGPVNEPILCSTVTEFKDIFGNVPYKFESNEDLGGSTYARVGNYEKSYIYAIELLRAGMPILFERIPSNSTKAEYKVPMLSNESDTTNGLTITAKNPGAYGKNINFNLIPQVGLNTRGGYLPIIFEGSTFLTGSQLVISESIIVVAKESGFEKIDKLDDTEGSIAQYIEDTFNGLTVKQGVTIKPLKNVVLSIMDEATSTEIETTFETNIATNSQIQTYTNMYTFNVEYVTPAGAETYRKSVSYNYEFSSDPNSVDYVANKEFELVDLKLNIVGDDYIIAQRSGSLIYNNLGEDGNLRPEFTITNLFTYLFNNLDRLSDRGTYQFKFLTSGSYPTYGVNNSNLTKKLLAVAASRGDCVALVDHLQSSNIIDIYNDIQTLALDATSTGEDPMKYGAMFTPWGVYNINSLNIVTELPASFAYLRCLTNSAKSNATWNAVAGVTRGKVLDLLNVKPMITGAVADVLQSRTGVSINPITEIKPYGNCIWGNRTLFNNRKELTASSFLNIRMLCSDIKKKVYEIAKELTFELNTEILWLNFKSKLIPTLDQMVSGNGLSGYKIIKTPTDKKATVACTIKLYAIEAVEDWDITIELSDSYVSVE